MDAAETVRRERMIVGRVDVHRADADKQRQRTELDRNHDVVGRRALTRSPEQQPRDEHHDAERGHVDEYRYTGDVRRRVQQPVDLGIRTEKRGAITGGEPLRQDDAGAGARQQRLEVVTPGDGDRDVADRVLEDQIPADDPRDQFAERRVRVGVRAARLRNHRRELRVAEARECAGGAKQEEREHQRGSRAGAYEMAGRVELARRRRPDRAEDPGADDGADGEHDQIAGAERPLQALLAADLPDERGNGLALE